MNFDTDSHPSEARLVAYVDGELGPDERAAVSDHLSGCDACARSLSELRRASSLFSDAAAALEPPPSEATAVETRRRAAHVAPSESQGTDDGADVPDDTDGESRFRWSRWSTATRIAASIVVLLGAAAALPGSPVRSWIDRSVQQVQALFGEDEATPATVEPEAPRPERPEVRDRSGVAVSASSGSIVVTLRDVPRTTSVRVRLVDGEQAGVWNAGGEYRTAPGRIEVTAPASDSLLVEIPRLVGRVELEVNDRLVAVGRGGELDVRVPDVEVRDGEFTFRPPGTN